MEDAKRQKIEIQKKGLESNRTLCGALCVFLVYVTFKDFKTNPGSPVFYAAMAFLFLAALGLAIRDTILISRLKKELLAANAQEEQESQARTEAEIQIQEKTEGRDGE